MPTTEQIKAARMLLGWDQIELARHASLGVATVRRIEAQPGIAGGAPESVSKIRAALEAAGIEFLGTAKQAPGVRLRRR